MDDSNWQSSGHFEIESLMTQTQISSAHSDKVHDATNADIEKKRTIDCAFVNFAAHSRQRRDQCADQAK